MILIWFNPSFFKDFNNIKIFDNFGLLFEFLCSKATLDPSITYKFSLITDNEQFESILIN